MVRKLSDLLHANVSIITAFIWWAGNWTDRSITMLLDNTHSFSLFLNLLWKEIITAGDSLATP